MWFSVVCTLIDNDMRHYSGQNVVNSRGTATTNFDLCDIVVDKSTDNDKPHSICFLPQYMYQRQRKCFFSERDQERDTLTRAALSGVLLTMAD